MKHLIKRLICGALVITLISCLVCVSASTFSSLYLNSYRASVTPASGGRMVVSADVTGRGPQEQIGVTLIYIYESKDDEHFRQVASYSCSDYPNMMSSGTVYSKDIVTYYGTPGYYYMASVYCYAGDGTNGTERNYTTVSRQAIS